MELTLLRARRPPEIGLVRGRVESPRDLGVRVRGDEERDVTFPTRGKEPRGATRSVGARDHRTLHQRGVVTRVVALRDRRGELTQCGVKDLDVVGDRVGSGVARAQLGGQGLTRQVGEDEERVKPVMPISA